VHHPVHSPRAIGARGLTYNAWAAAVNVAQWIAGLSNRYCIDRVALDHGEMPVSVQFSYGAPPVFAFTIVRLTATDVQGVGEVLVPPNRFLEAYLQNLIGRDARALDSLLPATDDDVDRILCEAVSIALHDLVGRLSGLPVHALLGGAPRRNVPLMPCIFPGSADEAAQKAQHFFSKGFQNLKTKLSGHLHEDLQRVRAIRSVAPQGAELLGDANEGYKTLPDARHAVEALGAAGLDIFEDPLQGQVLDYQKLKATGGARVMVDRLARRTTDLLAVLTAGAADMINIHPDQPGSLTLALHHVRLAQDFGVPVRIGGTGYTGVGTAAYQHLAAVATPGEPCGELGGTVDHGMPAATVVEPLKVDQCHVLLGNTPGLGVELNLQTLEQYGTGHREWGR
jgi:muconate cycloisomerase